MGLGRLETRPRREALRAVLQQARIVRPVGL